MPHQQSWPTAQLASWQDFLNRVSEILAAAPYPPAYIFRGQPDAEQQLIPSFRRRLGPAVTAARALQIEEMASKEFMAQAHLFMSASSGQMLNQVNRRLARWALMQHYGAPTRLLDWTASPYVAAYFAVEQLHEKEGAIFLVHPSLLHDSYPDRPITDNDSFEEALLRPDAPNRVYFFWPDDFRTERVVAQQGNFSVSLSVLGSHDDALSRSMSPLATKHPDTLLFAKWVIPAALKPVLLRQLRVMNVASHALFPGMDGLGRSIGELVRLEGLS